MRPRHVRVTTKTELKRIWNDRPQLLIYIIGPIILCTIMGFVAFKSPEGIDLSIFVSKSPEALVAENEGIQQLIDHIDESEPFSVFEVSTHEEGMRRLEEGETNAVVTLIEGASGLEGVDILVDETDPTIKQCIYSELPSILEGYSDDKSVEMLNAEGMAPEKSTEIISPINVTIETNGNGNISFFDSYASGLIILVVLGIPLLQAVTAITSERSKGTIERVFASPFGKGEIITGKLLALSVFAIIVAVLTTATLKIIFDITLGNLYLVLLTAALVGISGVIIGLLISSITYSEAQSMLVGVLVFLGFVILMTFLWPFETMHPYITYVSQGIPFTYAIDTIRRLNIAGSGLLEIWMNLAILSGSIVVLSGISTIVLKREIR
ncbi:MAG: ABC transporter permease [Chloroflexota bacterium]|nr:ABC transporter permease [Chloroflexota bacterium]